MFFYECSHPAQPECMSWKHSYRCHLVSNRNLHQRADVGSYVKCRYGSVRPGNIPLWRFAEYRRVVLTVQEPDDIITTFYRRHTKHQQHGNAMVIIICGDGNGIVQCCAWNVQSRCADLVKAIVTTCCEERQLHI